LDPTILENGIDIPWLYRLFLIKEYSLGLLLGDLLG
jgi:hypothetical protein